MELLPELRQTEPRDPGDYPLLHELFLVANLHSFCRDCRNPRKYARAQTPPGRCGRRDSPSHRRGDWWHLVDKLLEGRRVSELQRELLFCRRTPEHPPYRGLLDEPCDLFFPGREHGLLQLVDLAQRNRGGRHRGLERQQRLPATVELGFGNFLCKHGGVHFLRERSLRKWLGWFGHLLRDLLLTQALRLTRRIPG